MEVFRPKMGDIKRFMWEMPGLNGPKIVKESSVVVRMAGEDVE